MTKQISLFFVTTLIFYSILLVAPNNKVIFGAFISCVVILTFFLQNFRISLLLVYLISWPISVGKTYVLNLVPANQLNLSLPTYDVGIANYVIISAQEILIGMMFLVLIRDFFISKRKVFRWDAVSLSLGSLPILLIFVAVLGSLRPMISVLHSVYFIKPLIFYWYIKQYNYKHLGHIALGILAASVFFESFLAFFQFFRQSPLGLAIENSSEFLPVDISLDAVSSNYYRPLGTMAHSNALAHYLLPYIGLFFPFLTNLVRKPYLPLIVSVFFASVVIMLSISRSVWASLLVFLLLFFYIYEKKWNGVIVLKTRVRRLIVLSLPFLIPIIGVFIVPRITKTFSAFDTYGAGYARVELLQNSLSTIWQYPFTGVGIGMDIFHNYSQVMQAEGSESVLAYFPEAVHNGYLQLTEQAGMLVLGLFLVISILLAKSIWVRIHETTSIEHKGVLLSTGLGLVALYLNILLQPFTVDLQTCILFCYLLTKRQLVASL